MHWYKHFRWILDFSQSRSGHFEHGEFGCRAESVLYTAQKSVGALVVTLELENHVHDVLQYLRSGYETVLRNMSYEDYRDA